MPAAIAPRIIERHIEIPADYHRLGAILRVPHQPAGVVVFAHGSGSGRFSPRNQYVAYVLEQAGMATLLLDLLEEDEADDREMVFNIDLLADRLRCAANWLAEQTETCHLRLGYFGASTGAAAALQASTYQSNNVGAVVCRGGRPDLAMDSLEYVQAPTLLIVGSRDTFVLDLNEKAFRSLHEPKQLRIVKGATHLFEEPGTLSEVALLAKDWFLAYLPEAKPSSAAPSSATRTETRLPALDKRPRVH